jgi:hypothetical protein
VEIEIVFLIWLEDLPIREEWEKKKKKAHLQFVPPTNMGDDLQTLQKASGNSNYPSPLEKLNVLQIFWKLTKRITYECHFISSYYYGHFIMGEGIKLSCSQKSSQQTLYTLKASITSRSF